MRLLKSFVRAECKAMGISFKSLPHTGEFRISYRSARGVIEYFTDDLQDALDTARSESFRRDLQGAKLAPVVAKPVSEPARYWIQEQAPAGNFFDSVGMREGISAAGAITQFRAWQSTFPDRVCRLIARTDVVVKS